MHDTRAAEASVPLTMKTAVGLALAAVASFHLAYARGEFGCFIGVYLLCLYSLAGLSSSRRTFYFGLVVGLAVYGPQLGFFYVIFGLGATVLWLVLALWIGLFLVLVRACRQHIGKIGAALLAPFLWTGLEYFRSELYYLRFSWLNVGNAFSDSPLLPFMMALGIYGLGFILMGGFAAISLMPAKGRLISGAMAVAILGIISRLALPFDPPTVAEAKRVYVAGLQAEFPAELEVTMLLDQLVDRHPEAELLALSEYTFDGPVPERVKAWCRKNRRFLVAGAKDPAPGGQFYNTAFVIDPRGEVVFRQAKCVPIQFFKDGLPALEQRIWDSPWGKIGFCICYDLSYRRVTDALIQSGAQALIVPTMDLAEWGAHQHWLNARIAPIRAAEYGIPIFRLASSGISQIVDATGKVMSSAPYPGEHVMIAGSLRLAKRGTLPADQILAPITAAVTAVVILGLGVASVWRARMQRKKP